MKVHEPNRNPVLKPESRRTVTDGRRNAAPVGPRPRSRIFMIAGLLISLAINIAMLLAYTDLKSSFDGLVDDYLDAHSHLRAAELELKQRNSDIEQLHEELEHKQDDLNKAETELQKIRQYDQQSIDDKQECLEQLRSSKSLADTYLNQLRSLQQTHFKSLVSHAELMNVDPALARQLLRSASSFATEFQMDASAAVSLLSAIPRPAEIPEGVNMNVVSVRDEGNALLVDVEVMTADGKFVPNLQRVDFEVMTGDRRLHMVSVGRSSRSDQSHAIMLVLDTSSSTKGQPHDQMKAAAVEFVTSIANPSRLRVYQFSDLVSAVSPFCKDGELHSAAIRALDCNGGTALYRAIRIAFEDLHSVSGQRSIVVFTDGNDSFNNENLDAILDECTKNSIKVHVVALATGEVNESVLREISERTAGIYLSTPDPKELSRQFQIVAASFRRPVYRINILEPVSPEQLSLKLGLLPAVKLVATPAG